MTFLKNALARIRPHPDAPRSETGSDGVMMMVLALIFAPIVLAHVAFTLGYGEAAAPPGAAVGKPLDAR